MTKPIRVIFEIHPHTLGGTERFLLRFLERLDRRLYEPLVVSREMGRPLQLVRSTGVRTEVFEDYFKSTGIVRLTEYMLKKRAALVQSNYYCFNLAVAANLAGMPHIWRLGGHVSLGSGLRSIKDTRRVLDLIRLLSRSVICNSNYVRRQFCQPSGRPRVQVIPNGIALPPFAEKEKSEDFRVGMIAHFTPQKRHMDFIRAAELVSATTEKVTFAIVGGPYAHASSRSYANKVRRRAERLQQQGRFSFSEFAEAESDVYRQFDVIVLPSIDESFSNAILEAMASGVPVVAARSGGNPELVEHRKTGLLVKPMCPEEIAHAILLLIRRPELIDRMGRAAKRRAATHFHIDDCVRRYEAVYSKVVAG